MDKNAAKKAYKRAMLVVHPDRQPPSASAERKYLSTRLFEMLSTANAKFESEP